MCWLTWGVAAGIFGAGLVVGVLVVSLCLMITDRTRPPKTKVL